MIKFLASVSLSFAFIHVHPLVLLVLILFIYCIVVSRALFMTNALKKIFLAPKDLLNCFLTNKTSSFFYFNLLLIFTWDPMIGASFEYIEVSVRQNYFIRFKLDTHVSTLWVLVCWLWSFRYMCHKIEWWIHMIKIFVWAGEKYHLPVLNKN